MVWCSISWTVGIMATCRTPRQNASCVVTTVKIFLLSRENLIAKIKSILFATYERIGICIIISTLKVRYRCIPEILMINCEKNTLYIILRVLIRLPINICMQVRHWENLGERSPNFWKVGEIINNTPKGGLWMLIGWP